MMNHDFEGLVSEHFQTNPDLQKYHQIHGRSATGDPKHLGLAWVKGTFSQTKRIGPEKKSALYRQAFGFRHLKRPICAKRTIDELSQVLSLMVCRCL